MVEKDRHLERRPRNTDIASPFEKPRVSVPAAIEQVGFSSRFTERLRELNYVLGIIGKPRVEGFNLELLPDTVFPTIDIKLDLQSPFKVEVMGDGRHAAVRVRTNNISVEMPIADIQEFTHSTFPKRKIVLVCLPRRYNDEGFSVPLYTKIPTSLYEEEQSSDWRNRLEEFYSKTRAALGNEMFFPIEIDLYDVTEGLLASLICGPEDSRYKLMLDLAEISGKLLNSPYQKFQVYLKKGKRPLLELRGNLSRLFYRSVGRTEGAPSFTFSQLYFGGKPQDVEKVIAQFTELLKKTSKYKKAVGEEEQKDKGIAKQDKLPEL